MELLNKDRQMDAVGMVLEEMKSTEVQLMSWRAFWWEKYLNCVLPQQYFDRPHWINDELGKEVSKIDFSTYSTEDMGVPLKHINLGGLFSCDICSIRWSGIETKNSIRNIVFHNSGNIEISKKVRRHVTKQHLNQIGEYNASYNVLDDDFDINFVQSNLVGGYKPYVEYSSIDISFSKDILHISYKDVVIDYNLNTGIKIVKIKKDNAKKSNATVDFEVCLNSDGSIVRGLLSIDTHKGNGKVNGSYRFTINQEKGNRAMYYSRKGVGVNLTQNTALLYNSARLLLKAANDDN